MGKCVRCYEGEAKYPSLFTFDNECYCTDCYKQFTKEQIPPNATLVKMVNDDMLTKQQKRALKGVEDVQF